MDGLCKALPRVKTSLNKLNIYLVLKAAVRQKHLGLTQYDGMAASQSRTHSHIYCVFQETFGLQNINQIQHRLPRCDVL